MDTPFVHLHLHTEYSLIDGMVRIGPLVEAVAAVGMPALAVTDQCNMFALVKFYRAAQGAGVKPIAGADLWLRGGADPRRLDRLVLLCQDDQGYRNLNRLLSRAWGEGQRRGVPTLQADWLTGHAQGLIALSGREGDVARLLTAGHENQARARLEQWMEQFDGRFYLEVTRTGREGEERHVRAAARLGHRLGCPLVASNDVRFLKREDFEAHEARVCIHQGRTLNDPRRPRDYSAEQYLKTPEEMAEAFADLPGALANAVAIAKRCNLELEFGSYHLPAYPTPQDESVETHLQGQARMGLTKVIDQFGLAPGFARDDYDQRLQQELDVIAAMGFAGYFLIVADFIRWAREQDIPVGPGRGSGAGSLVAYSLGITTLDPLRYGLLFERFLNPERVSMPDFDVDFCMERRDRVIDYVSERYGQAQVGQIITFGTMAARAVVRDAGRVLGHPYGFVDRIAKLVPFQLGITLDAALKQEADLKQAYDEDEDIRELIDLARSLEGLARNAGRHAGGVVIAPGDLQDFMPLFFEQGGSQPVTQFDKDDVETMGLVKFDFLGLRTLTIIDWAVAAVNAGGGKLDIDAIPMDDKKTFDLLRRCRTTAVFQLESRGMKELIQRLRPDSFEEIIALVALFRPGPLQSGMVEDFIARKHGRARVDYPHPDLKSILKPTYGVILYQEQVMEIAQVLAGYSLGGADLLRRAMGKKKPEEMAKQRAVFVEGALARGVKQGKANAIFDLMEKFAGYGFNKSHSAAYALIAYQTAWLKAHYPAHYMAAVLSADMDHTDKVVTMIEEAQALDLRLDKPDVNASHWAFVARDENRIAYGLGAIKGVGRGAVESLIEARESGGPFRDLYDFCRRVDAGKLNRRVIEALLFAGALDELGTNRASLMASLPAALKAAEQASRDARVGQEDIFGGVLPADQSNGVAVTPERLPEWPMQRLLKGEREALGLYLSGHPLDPYAGELVRFVSCPIGEIAEQYGHLSANGAESSQAWRRQGPDLVLAGLIVGLRKRGGRMAFITLDDKTGRIEAALFDDSYRKYAEFLQPDRIVVVQGNLMPDGFTGGFRLTVQQLWDLDTARTHFAKGLEIELNGAGAEGVSRLCAVLTPYCTGQTPVWVELRGQDVNARVKLGEEWRVKANGELIEVLRREEGVGRARILY